MKEWVNSGTFGMDQEHRNTDASADTRKRTSQHTGSKSLKDLSHRSVVVCLVVLCVLLLTAVIVLHVLNYTNNHQNITEERDQLEREKDGLLSINNTLNTQKDQLTQQINRLWRILNEMDGWIYYQSSFYFISPEKKSWTESRKYCREKKSDLIIINNKQEQEFAAKATCDYSVWIGLSDSDEEGRWKWVDGSTLNYSFWASREPNGHRSENCAVSYSSGWYDYPCHRAFKWICERNILK